MTSEYITEPLFDGGLANYLNRVCIALSKIDFEPIIVVSAECEETFNYNNISVHRVCIVNKWLNLFNKLTANLLKETTNRLWLSWKLNKAIRTLNSERKIDIIQYANHLATGIFRPKIIPAIIRISHFEPLWNQAYEIVSSLDTKITEQLEIIALKKADYVFGPSKKIAKEVEKKIGKPVSIIKTPIFIELDCFDTKPYSDLLRSKKYLIFFGGIGLLKGVKTIADMINPLLSKYPDFFFVFIGNDLHYQGKPMMEYVWSKAGSNRGRVLYLGRMHHNQLYPIIQNAHAVILPSRVDNLPNVCLEAMALKKIVIGSRNTSMDELIIEGFNGFLSEVDDSNDLLKKIEIVIELDEKEHKRLSDNAYSESLRYSTELVIPTLVNYYHRLINNREH